MKFSVVNLKTVVCAVLSAFFFGSVAQAVPPIVADGCLPGDPCYVSPPRAQPKPIIVEKMVEVPAPEAITPIVIEEDECEYPMYVTAGAGVIFLEKDETVLNNLTTEVKFGFYRFTENVSLELGVGYAPDVRRRRHPNPGRFALEDDTESLQYSADFLFHMTSVREGFDPYLTLGGGVIDYKDKLEDGHTDVFASAGAGTFMSLSEQVFFKPDYRIMMVGDNTEVNHKATLALGLRF